MVIFFALWPKTVVLLHSARMDTRAILPLLAAGWLLLTLGVWGAFPAWWIWPLSLGMACLASGALLLFAAARQEASRRASAPAERASDNAR